MILAGLGMMIETVKESERDNVRGLWSIDNVRVYGVTSVVLAHALEVTERFHRHLSGGVTAFQAPMGLDVFFVLSGFLVWKVTRLKPSSGPLFLAHRVTRIYPLYMTLTLLYAPFVVNFPLHIGHNPGTSLTDVILSLLLVPHLDSGGSIYPLLGPAWTLILDMYYFVLFSLVLCLQRQHQLLCVTLLFLAPVLGHVALHPTNIFWRTYTDPRAASFLLGVWVAHLYNKCLTLPLRIAQLMAAASIIVYVTLTALHVPYYRLGIVAWMAAAGLAVYGTVSIQAAGSQWGRLPFAATLGRWSYAIYLSQVFAIPLAIYFVPGSDAEKICVAVAASIAFGGLAHELIERPINRVLSAIERGALGTPARNVTVAP